MLVLLVEVLGEEFDGVRLPISGGVTNGAPSPGMSACISLINLLLAVAPSIRLKLFGGAQTPLRENLGKLCAFWSLSSIRWKHPGSSLSLAHATAKDRTERVRVS